MEDALTQLADAVGAKPSNASVKSISPEVPKGAVTSHSVAQALAALLPDGAIIVDESVSFGRAFFSGTQNTAPHDWLQLTGGAIGSGIPMSTGAAIAAPGRRVVNLQADGSALYTVQGLWTQARENLDVTTVILSNRRYAILVGELKNVGATAGDTATKMLSLSDPAIGWIGLARSLGVEAAQAETMEIFADLFSAANRRRGPFLIELVIPGPP